MARSDTYPTVFNLKCYGLPSLACDVALEIDAHITKNKDLLSLVKNSSSKLAKILKDKTTKLERKKTSEMHLEIEEIFLLKKVLETHQKNSTKTPYIIKSNIGKLTEIKEEIIPTIYRISENLKSYRQLPKGRQEILRDFVVELSKELMTSQETALRKIVA